jgi:hypothetical protein
MAKDRPETNETTASPTSSAQVKEQDKETEPRAGCRTDHLKLLGFLLLLFEETPSTQNFIWREEARGLFPDSSLHCPKNPGRLPS